MIFDNHDSQDTYAGVKTSADWDWLTFPDYLERRWIPQGDGTFELQLLVSATDCFDPVMFLT